VEQLEEANDSQLYTILNELKQTAFFRNFAVDLDHRCPLATWGKKKNESVIPPPPSSSTGGSAKNESKSQVDVDDNQNNFSDGNENENEIDESETCSSGGLPDAPPDSEPACHVDLGQENSFMPWQSHLHTQSSASHENKDRASSKNSLNEIMTSSSSEELPDKNTHTSEDEYECTGGTIAHEIDEDAEPLCHLTEEELTHYFEPESTTPLRDLFSSALNAVNRKMGWDSESEMKTFTWVKPSDPIVVSNHDITTPCADEGADGSLPDTFWLDMCSNITAGDGLKVVNLVLNPERNTGYNGTHIWTSIYEENCINLDGDRNLPMCYEERVLYRLLSGLHTSTTLSIAKNYYPPNKRKGRDIWTPNPTYFYQKFVDNPEYIRNLHFSYVVMLRALKKAYPFLYNYEIRTGDIVEDATATFLLKRLLDSTILSSCNDVFSAFDESLMFKKPTEHLSSYRSLGIDSSEHYVSLEENFKGVFHNVSSILDCVQCQQCKLHGKMAMLGYGTGLKILFTPRDELLASALSRNEIVAFINTIAKLSESIKEVRELTHLYWASQFENNVGKVSVVENVVDSEEEHTLSTLVATDPFDAAVGAIATLSRSHLISEEREIELIKLAIDRDETLLVLAKHYASNLNKFLLHLQNIDSNTGSSSEPDAIVVGTGLAGLAATLNILDRGGKVILIEKEHLLGGNSNKASSGINACCPNKDTLSDTIESFMSDTIRSAGEAARPDLIKVLVENSASAVNWLKERVGVDLSLVAQLGGHQNKRTHRPSNGMVGAEIIYGMQKAVKEYVKSGAVEILLDTQVTKLLSDDDGRVLGVEVKYLTDHNLDNRSTHLRAPNVVLATGGFAADRSENSYLSQYRPELLKMPATAGHFSTGDGIGIARKVGAGLVDMEKVQIHPTGWVDPRDPTNPNKILAAELMRGIGGILINKSGQRFCNELGTRAYVTDMMLSHDLKYAQTKQWSLSNEIPTFSLVLSSSAADDGKKHVDHYTHKGLLTRIEGIADLAEWMGVNEKTLRHTFSLYQKDAVKGEDQWGKTSFRGAPQNDLDKEIFFAGTVTPVLHYCMGGITIDTEGNVLNEEGVIIQGLHAAGEVSGGVHGDNRLGGNSLLECTVFGTIVGKKIPIKSSMKKMQHQAVSVSAIKKQETRKEDKITPKELAQHNSPEDCWVAIHGKVYDLSAFAEEHPAGAESIHKLAGMDGTEEFQAIHNIDLLNDFEDDIMGVYTGN
jgi:flavocytochrome c